MTVFLGFAVCGFGVQRGVEQVTKVMMMGLLGLIVLLAGNSLMLDGGAPGLAFYLLPDWGRAVEAGLGNVAAAAMNQAFLPCPSVSRPLKFSAATCLMSLR